MELIFLTLGWLCYSLLHSLFAALSIKHRITRQWPDLARVYRLLYNLTALLLLLPLLWATYTLPGDWLWRWTGMGAWIANGLGLAAIAGFLFSSGSYDMDEFLGLKPLREGRRDAVEHDGFRLSPLHRHVRHPWYFLGLVLIWTRDMNAPILLSTTAITLYLIVGSRLEERKLEAHFGEVYRSYCAKVPGLLPLPWRRLSVAEANQLVLDSVQGARH